MNAARGGRVIDQATTTDFPLNPRFSELRVSGSISAAAAKSPPIPVASRRTIPGTFSVWRFLIRSMRPQSSVFSGLSPALFRVNLHE